MDWREKININKIESESENRSSYSKFYSFFKKSPLKTQTSLNDNTIPVEDDSHLTPEELFKSKQAIVEKDLTAISLFILAIMGMLAFVTSDQIPSIGQNFLLGIDIDSWWFFSKVFTFIIGAKLTLALVWKLRGESQSLESLLKIIPNHGKGSVKNLGLLFLVGIIINLIIQFSYPESFKTPTSWKVLEAQQITSRSPEKRAEFVQKAPVMENSDSINKLFIVPEDLPSGNAVQIQEKPDPEVIINDLSKQKDDIINQIKNSYSPDAYKSMPNIQISKKTEK